jgi:hypothetical protein
MPSAFGNSFAPHLEILCWFRFARRHGSRRGLKPLNKSKLTPERYNWSDELSIAATLKSRGEAAALNEAKSLSLRSDGSPRHWDALLHLVAR